MAPTAQNALPCAHCDKTFARSAHRKRHELTHTGESHFRCSACEKQFSRKDALQRHELTHQETLPSLIARGVHACVHCAAAKARCSGHTPCARCERRGQQCVYRDEANGSMPSVSAISPPEISSLWHPDPTAQGSHPVAALEGQEQAGNLSSLQPPLSVAYQELAVDPDFWGGNALSTINWLEVIDVDFPVQPFDIGFPTNPIPVYGDESVLSVPDRNLLQSQASNHHATARQSSQLSASSPLSHDSAPSASSALSRKTAAEIYAAQVTPTSENGEYYVDGESARLPRVKRRKLTSQYATNFGHDASSVGFSLRSPIASERHLEHRVNIAPATYESIFGAWSSTCTQPAFPWRAFDDVEFPAHDIFEHLLALYVAHFHQVLPFLHLPSFDGTEIHWLLILAMATTGANYLGEEGAPILAASLAELLRRCLVCTQESSEWTTPGALIMAQVRLLQLIGLVYSRADQQVKRGLELQQTLVTSYFALVHELTDNPATQESSIDPEQVEWTLWARDESTRRTAYSIWLLDCMVAYQFQRRPLLKLSDVALPLPCSEDQWSATTAQEWKVVPTGKKSLPGLQEALQEIYIDKRFPRDRGEFARVLVIHGLYHRTWEVERYFENPLSQWEPSAKKRPSGAIPDSKPMWLLSIPTYTKWQNSVCDCIDILHWQANATIGVARGIEHPTVAHLHLARVILLSPIQHIVRLASTMAGVSSGAKDSFEDDKRTIQLWAVQGQYKARLAAIHAGVGFWHIRRHSVDAFYEVPAIALSALMLWAFATFSITQNASQQASNGRQSKTSAGRFQQDFSEDAASDDSACEIILLDRPTDDELVQQFVRRGHIMRAHMSGVGNLYGAEGPRRVLMEGCKLLGTLKCWGVQAFWFDLLQRLTGVCNAANAKS